MRQVLTRLYRAEIRGVENVPPAGPCILVANHESLIDPWILCLATPRRVRFMAKAELWRYPGIRWAMEAYGTFPVERGNGDTGAMRRAGELLAAGEVLGMFPRGTSGLRETRSGTVAPPGWRSPTAPTGADPAGRHPSARAAPADPRARRQTDRGRAATTDDRDGEGIDHTRRGCRGSARVSGRASTAVATAGTA